MILFREPFPERFIGTRIPDDFIRLVRAKEPGSELVLSQDGTDRYIGYVPSGSGPPDLYISAGVSTKSAFAFLNEALRLNLLLITVAALGSVAAATYVGHRLIHRPLVAIRSVARSWLAGDYTRRTGMHSNAGEIGAVGAALDKMVEELGLRETDRRLAEEQRLILVRELQHRVKNTLAVVQAIAGQSLRGTPETAVQMEAFRARLAALSQTYDILTDQNWRGASLQTVVRDSLATQFPEGRFRLSGPDPHIKPNAALALSLALHELATNALKYGALSTPTGSVDVNWSMEDGATPSFLMTWTESGGPPATTPEREGFGSRLLGRILAQQLSGTTAVEWLPTGLRFTVRCPLDQLRDQG
jgi:two-component sensor histidine kinase/HAMP domain-containing protein